VQTVAAFGSLTLTLALVLARPKIGRFGALNPALCAAPGLVVMFASGVLAPVDLHRALSVLWRPLLTVAAIMATTSVAHRLGIFDRITRSIEIRTRSEVPRAFATVYVIGAATSAVFNNDAAILLLTPIVVPVIRRLYPRRPYLVVPFSFAIFMSAGVAPLCTSNPMNLVVAEHAGLGFNQYALRMLPVALAGSIVSYAMLRIVFRRQLEDSIPATGKEQGSLLPMDPTPRSVLVVVLAMLTAYPVLSYFNAPVWIAGVTGALVVCGLALRHDAVTPSSVVRGVAWDVLAFLFCIYLTALGLENVGLTTTLGRTYAIAESPAGQLALIGGVSAIGSAILNNHPMGALNALVVGSMPGDAKWRTLAALIGGDLGPRLLPMGSLAGLLWIEMARRLGVEIRLKDFVRTGVLVTVPALVLSLVVLWLEQLLVGEG
jgi:arsenical pump membrane protein